MFYPFLIIYCIKKVTLTFLCHNLRHKITLMILVAINTGIFRCYHHVKSGLLIINTNIDFLAGTLNQDIIVIKFPSTIYKKRTSKKK